MDTQTLLSHGDFVRNVVRGLLRDEHQVDDVVQDTMLTALRSPPRRRTALRAWLARVGRNRALTVARGEGRRHHREFAAARPETTPDATERLARSREVVEAVMALDEPYKTTVVERFFEGLSTVMVAQRHGVSTVTVRTRVRDALERLREHFDHRRGRTRWHSMLLPLAAAVPSRSAAAATATAASITGGLAMKTAFFVIASVVAGVAIGWGVAPSGDSSGRASHRDAMLASNPEHQRLKQSHAELSRRAEKLEKEKAELATTLAAEREQSKADASAAVKHGVDAAGIDWAALEGIVRKQTPTLAKMAQLIRERKSMGNLSPEEQAGIHQLRMRWSAAAAKARTVATNPMLDKRFLPRVINTLLGAPLQLTAAQKTRLEQELLAMLAAEELPSDPTPIEAYLARRKILAGTARTVAALLDAGQREAWKNIGPVWNEFKRGNRRTLRLGLRNGVNTRNHVLKEFTTHYGLTEAQMPHLVEVVGRYLDEARALLGKHGQLGDERRALSEGDRRKLGAGFHALQRQVEKEILPRLTASQRAKLGRQLPLLLAFDDSLSDRTSTFDDRGF